MKEKAKELSSLLKDVSALEGLQWIAEHFRTPRFSTALGEEDQVLTQLITSHHLPIEIFTLDTGRLFPETYDLLSLTTKSYQANIKTYFPASQAVETFVQAKGINAFYDSVDNRKQCCFVRKVEPLKRALAGADIWVTGLRSEQSINRQQMDKVEWDEGMKIFKYNPLLDWSLSDLQTYIDTHAIPVNTLHKKGFASIGCAPCTRAIFPGEDIRAGRWWWETSAKECGLHQTTLTEKN